MTTLRLLIAGAVAGPFFIASSLVQAVTRAGFDPARHPPSALALGDAGWVQVVTFVMTGLGFTAGAIGLHRTVTRRVGRWAPWFVGGFGIALVTGGLFRMDPAFGFPPGTRDGVGESVSWHPAIHGILFPLGFACVLAAGWSLSPYYTVAGPTRSAGVDHRRPTRARTVHLAEPRRRPPGAVLAPVVRCRRGVRMAVFRPRRLRPHHRRLTHRTHTQEDRMTTTDADVQALVGPQLQALAHTLADQPTTIADEPSLCDGWAVRHVVAHMTMAARYDGPTFMAELAAVGHDFEALSQRIAQRDGDLPFASLLADLRSDTMAAWAPPGGGATGALSHVVIHSLDITAALDLPRAADDPATRLVLDTLTAGGVTAHFGTDTTGWMLCATDLDWTFGSGTPREASAGDLVLALAGRARRGVDLRAAVVGP